MKRDWSAAVARWEGHWCLVCAHPGVDLAHVLGRAYDEPLVGGRRGTTLYVHPSSVVPLCSFAKGSTRGCHQTYDHHDLNLRPFLPPDVWEWAVERVGEGNAARRILGPDWRI